MDFQPRFYQVKRYLVMLFCAGTIIYLIVLAIVIASQNEQQFLCRAAELKTKLGLKSEKDENIKMSFTIFLSAFFLVMVIFEVIGFVGAWRQHFCLTASNVALTIVVTVLDFASIFFGGASSLWFAALWSVIISATSLLFLRDLFIIRKFKLKQQNQQTN